MSFLSKALAVDRAPATLEETLVALAAYGQPKVCLMDRGWHAWVKLTVSAVGATVEVASDYGMKSPGEAATQCHQRVIQTVRDLGRPCP